MDFLPIANSFAYLPFVLFISSFPLCQQKHVENANAQ